MSHVVMEHPQLPDQPIEVDEVSVPHYRASGWQVVPPKVRAPRRRMKKDEDH